MSFILNLLKNSFLNKKILVLSVFSQFSHIAKVKFDDKTLLFTWLIC